MDGPALIQSVLNADERLLWTGRPLRWPRAVGLALAALLVAELGRSFMVLGKAGRDPLPVYLQLELAALALIFAVSIAFFVYKTFRDWNVTYALTNQRLLMAFGARQENMRVLALKELAFVALVQRGRRVRNLVFETLAEGWTANSLRPVTTAGLPPGVRAVSGTITPTNRTGVPVWTFLTTGQPDKRRHPWIVKDPEEVRRLITAAQAACQGNRLPEFLRGTPEYTAPGTPVSHPTP